MATSSAKQHAPSCEWVQDRIESYLDADLTSADCDSVTRHLTECTACAEDLSLAREVAEGLRAMPKLRAPEDLRARIAEIPRRHPRFRVASRIQWLAAAAVILLTAGVIYVVNEQQSTSDGLPASDGIADTPPAEFTQPPILPAATAPEMGPAAPGQRRGIQLPQLAQAENELKATLAYLGRITQRSTKTPIQTLEKTVLPRLGATLKLFTQPSNQETHNG